MKDPESFGELVDGLPVVAFRCTPEGEVRALSSYWTHLTGQPLSEALGKGWAKHLDHQKLAATVTKAATKLRPGESVQYVVRCRGQYGDWFWLRAAIRPEWQGSRLTGLSGLAMVVPPEPSLTEGETATEVDQGGGWAEALLMASPDALYELTPDGVYVDCRAPETPRGLPAPAAFLGKTIEDMLPPAVAQQARVALEKALASGHIQHLVYELPTEWGSRYYESRVLPMKKSGRVLFVVRDVTVARRNESELVAAREEALERSRLKTQFLANISHEIRTPLNGILGVTQLLKQHSLPMEFREYVDVLQGSGESLLAIVNDVLDLSKIEANRLELEPRVFDLEKVVTETARSQLAVAQRKGIELRVEVAPEARGPVRGDPARIRQIINNLVGNAVKFTDTGSVKVLVDRHGERVRITVTDTGTGIAPEHHARIFEAFEQAEVGVQRRFGGTGLGLAITRRIARLMGGDVTVESALKRGSKFELEVPLPSVVISHNSSTPSRVTAAPKALRVLLAEDDAVNASITAALLRKLGHLVQVVSNGKDCVAEVKKGSLDLVLMDVHMPVLDGLEATRVIRESERGTKRHIPIVALTANAMKGDDLMCLSAGMDAYLPKPVTVSVLKDLLTWFGSQDN